MYSQSRLAEQQRRSVLIALGLSALSVSLLSHPSYEEAHAGGEVQS